MMRWRLVVCALGSIWLATDASGQAQLPGYGHAASGMGGASIAVPYDSVATANNPAGMAYVGTRTDLIVTVIYTNDTTELGPLQYDASDVGYGPSGGFNVDLHNGWTAGISLYGFGSGIDYGKPFPGSTTNTKSSVAQLVAAPTVTYRVAPQQAVGVALLAAAQRIDIAGLQNAGFADPGSDKSYGVGVSVGYLGNLDPELMLGVSYASRISMGRLHKYANELADGGKLDIPQQFGIGLGWHPTGQVTAAFDYLWINWASVKPLGNPFPGSGPPGSPQGPGFGWQNQNVYRLGIAYDANDSWTLRAGGAYKSRLIVPESVTLNTLAPLVPQVSLTLGATYKIDQRQILTLSYAHNFQKSVNGTQASAGVNLTADASFVTFGYGYAF